MRHLHAACNTRRWVSTPVGWLSKDFKGYREKLIVDETCVDGENSHQQNNVSASICHIHYVPQLLNFQKQQPNLRPRTHQKPNFSKPPFLDEKKTCKTADGYLTTMKKFYPLQKKKHNSIKELYILRLQKKLCKIKYSTSTILQTLNSVFCPHNVCMLICKRMWYWCCTLLPNFFSLMMR